MASSKGFRSGPAVRIAILALWPAAFGFGLLSLAIARSHPEGSFAGDSWESALAELGAGWGLIGAGLYLRIRRPSSRSGYLLAAAGVGWFFAEWNNPEIGSSLGFTFGLLVWAMAPQLVAHAVLAYPSGGPLSLVDRIALLGGYLNAGVVLGLLPALVYDPPAEACNFCPPNLLLIRGDDAAFIALNWWGVHLGLIWTGALAVLVVWRFARSSVSLRRLTTPVVLGGVAYLLLVWADFAHSLPRGELDKDSLEQSLWLGQAGALCGIASGVVWSWLRARRTRSLLAKLVIGLGDSPPAGGLRQVLANLLADPNIAVAYPLANRDRYVDAGGMTVDLTASGGRMVTSLAREGRTVAVLIHRAGLLDDPDLVHEVAAAARVALENERLQAEVRAQLEDLRASRARIVATGDAERRRLERNLHDGAQQRLVALSLGLRLARTQLGPDPDPILASRIDQAMAEIRTAIDDLRELAHGIYPAVLADEGLAAAVDMFAERSAIPIRVVAVPDERFARQVEAAAYFLVAEASGTIAAAVGAEAVSVGVTREGDRLMVEVIEVIAEGGVVPTPQVEVALIELSDRLGAIGGRVWATPLAGFGITIGAEIPCGS
jgi:signal transduction histidine kinase